MPSFRTSRSGADVGGVAVSDWKTVQIFLSPRHPAVFETQLDTETSATRCNCPTFKGKRECRHTKFIAAKTRANGGNYPLMVRQNADSENISEVTATPEAFREFVLKYGKIEVI